MMAYTHDTTDEAQEPTTGPIMPPTPAQRKQQQMDAISAEFEQSYHNLLTALCFLVNFLLVTVLCVTTFLHAVIGMLSYFTTLALQWTSSQQVMLAYARVTIEQGERDGSGTDHR
jgi:hypothetical protein